MTAGGARATRSPITSRSRPAGPDRYAAGGFRRRAAFFRDEVLPRLAPAGDWLDVGCGSGVFSRMLAQAGARVLGLDGSPAMVEAARARLSAPASRFEVGRVEDVGALDRSFDGAICLSVLEYVPRPARRWRRSRAGSSRGGRLALSAPNRGSTLRARAAAAAPARRGGRIERFCLSRQLPASLWNASRARGAGRRRRAWRSRRSWASIRSRRGRCGR